MKLNEVSKFRQTDMDIEEIKERNDYFRVVISADHEENLAKMVDYARKKNHIKIIGKGYSEKAASKVLAIGVQKSRGGTDIPMNDARAFEHVRSIIDEIEGNT